MDRDINAGYKCYKENFIICYGRDIGRKTQDPFFFIDTDEYR